MSDCCRCSRTKIAVDGGNAYTSISVHNLSAEL
ncbi:hypothetical protein [Paraglaciecola chathamensis]